MESENDSILNDLPDKNCDTECLLNDDDLPPKQKRAFVKMLAKFIRCAIQVGNLNFVLCQMVYFFYSQP